MGDVTKMPRVEILLSRASLVDWVIRGVPSLLLALGAAMKGLDPLEIALVAILGLAIGLFLAGLYRFLLAHAAARDRLAARRDAKGQVSGAAKQALHDLLGRIAYAEEARSAGSERFATWKNKVAAGTQGVELGNIERCRLNDLSAPQTDAVMKVRSALGEVNNMPKMAGAEYNKDHTSSLFLYRARCARDALEELIELVAEKR